MGAWLSLCVGANGWVAGIASHRSVLLSRGWLVTVEAPGHPGHPPSTQLDAVVNLLILFKLLMSTILIFLHYEEFLKIENLLFLKHWKLTEAHPQPDFLEGLTSFLQ